MPDPQQQINTQDEQVAVTLQLDPKAYQFFLRKAQKAGVEIEPYLSSTLSIVLGCRVFNETIVCSPALSVEDQSLDGTKKRP